MITALAGPRAGSAAAAPVGGRDARAARVAGLSWGPSLPGRPCPAGIRLVARGL